jgi:serine/threonine-protein kinase
MSDLLDRLKTALADRYTIERELGAGGMATVYLAEDLKHARKVAIKVLRPELAAALGPERFLREVEVTASLNHPHILPLLDSGEADGFLHYVMPYVEGETLRDRMNREGQLPLDDALQITREVAAALSYAHSHDVIHRDIKPENILLSAGEAVVADFGIARAITAAGGEHLTETGISVGTPVYMSPEQASGERKLDGRSDVYSLACVLYEMLAGEPPYTGPTAQAIVAKKLSEATPRVSVVRERVPSSVEAALDQALAKTPADRFTTAAQFADALREAAAAEVVSTAERSRPQPGGRHWRWRVGAPLLLAGAVTVAAAVLLLSSSFERELQLTRTNIRPLTRAPEIEVEPTISPDGKEVVYTAGVGLDVHLYVRDLDLSGGRPIPLTADRPGYQHIPRWTPDGRSIVFAEVSASGGVTSHLIPRFGGPTRKLGSSVIWGMHGDREVYTERDSVVVRSRDGGEPTLVASAPLGPHSVAWSPDGSKLAYVQNNRSFVRIGWLGNVGPSSIWIVGVDGGGPVQVTNDTTLNVSPAWMPDGRHLLFVSARDGARDVYVVRVDGSGRPRSQPSRVTTGLDPHSISISADGSTVAYSQFTFRRNIWQIPIPESGSVSISEAKPVTFGNQLVESYGLSWDGRRLAFDSDLEGSRDIYVKPVEGGEPQWLTRDPGDDFHPEFSPDGNEIVFYSTRHGSRDVFLMSADGTNVVRLTDVPNQDFHPSFSPDGLRIAFTRRTAPGHEEIYVMSRDPASREWSAPRQLTGRGGYGASWSPDGSEIAYTGGNGIGIVSLEGEERLLLDWGAGGAPRARFPYP